MDRDEEEWGEGIPGRASDVGKGPRAGGMLFLTWRLSSALLGLSASCPRQPGGITEPKGFGETEARGGKGLV